MGLISINCPGCRRQFRVALSKIDQPAVCTFCNLLVEDPSQFRHEPSLLKLKVPLKGTIVTSDGSVDLEDVEAESDAYTGGRNAFTPEDNSNPAMAIAEATASRGPVGGGRKNTRRIRATTYRFVTIAMVSLVVVGVAVFIWQMIVHFGTATPVK